MQEADFVPEAPEITDRVAVAEGAARTAIVEIMRTDPAAVFEYPAGVTGNRGITYTAPTGDA